MSWFKGLRTQKSMLMWAKHNYHEAWEAYRMDVRGIPDDVTTIACDVSRVQTWEEVLYYLTGNREWLE